MYRYKAGKEDWAAYGLPIEGRLATEPTAGDAARRDVPTCGLTDQLDHVHNDVRAAGWDVCMVVNDARVVLGMLVGDDWKGSPREQVQLAMKPSPTTFRPDTPLNQLVERMRHKGHQHAVVTNPDGQLIGIVRREEAEKRVAHYKRLRPAESNRSGS